MSEISSNLDTIETRYTVFETDQVLTPAQLNSVADYLDDQGRLTRVALLGVGIACGLWPSLQGNSVRLSRGAGATTDGDAVFMPEAASFARYKRYDSSAPKYLPFYRGAAHDTMIAAYELQREEEEDARSRPLSEFAGAEGRDLGSMVAVLYVECCLHDRDLCTGTDCDNRGKDFVHATKLLLVDSQSAGGLLGALDTPDRAARALDPVVIARPMLRGALATEADLAGVYTNAGDAILKGLLPALLALYRPCRGFLQDLAPTDPGPRWKKALTDLRAALPLRGAQYYYDFLKDVAETYNAFRDALFGDTAVCCPDLDAFPKHLVLGSLDPAQRAATGRTGFYPSPMVSERFERRVHARFLTRKLDALIGNFAIPAGGDIRITPSASEKRDLEERAIPFYYAVNEQLPIHRAWSHKLSQRGMERCNYSYNADRYGAPEPAATPLEAQLGAFDFFRIEGHLGMNLSSALDKLRGEIVKWNLPIRIDAVHVGKDRTIVVDPPFRHPDLHLLQGLLREDVATELGDAAKFGSDFLVKAKAATGNVITDADNNGVPIVGTTQTKVELMTGRAQQAVAKLRAEQYDPASAWLGDHVSAAQTAGELKDALGSVTKDQFVSPLDSLLGGHSSRWLAWLDAILVGAKDVAADSALLSQYLRDHPGLEHGAGAPRGGTFVLAYDQSKTVVADFMLPYRRREDAPPPKPPKFDPLPRPDIVFDKAIRLAPFPDKVRFEKFRDDLVNDVKKQVETQTSYFNVFKDTLSIFAGGKAGGGLWETGLGQTVADPVLGMQNADTQWKAQKVDTLRMQLLDPSLDEAKRALVENQLESAEKELSVAILSTAEYVASTGMAVTPGSDGAKAMSTASTALSKVSDINALTDLEKGLTSLGNKTATTPETRTVIGNLLAGRGIR